MKKGEIKRRKRVVPVEAQMHMQEVRYSNEVPDETRSILSQTHGVSPAASSANPPSSRQPGAPIPVDFTDMYRRPAAINTASSHLTSQHRPQDAEEGSSRKRSRSESERGSEPPQPTIAPAAHSTQNVGLEPKIHPYHHAQNLPSPSQDVNVDPALTNSADGADASSAPTALSQPEVSTAQDAQQNSRRAELQREAERMRELLAAKEREIAALGEDG